MLLDRPAALVIAVVSATLLSHPAAGLSQDVGAISCDVVSAYDATSPAYLEVFQSFLEGYLAAENNAAKVGRDDRDAPTLMSAAVEYCKVNRDASFAAAVAATVK